MTLASATEPAPKFRPTHSDVALAHSIEAAARRLGIGRTKVFELIRTRRLVAVRFGRRTLIPEDALRDFLATLPHV